jgi:hypothetical protein
MAYVFSITMKNEENDVFWLKSLDKSIGPYNADENVFLFCAKQPRLIGKMIKRKARWILVEVGLPF